MPALRLLMGVVALVLLIVVANATTLLLSRNIVRSREMAIRRALGADQLRLVRQVVVESLVLSVGGCVAGSAIAVAMVWLIKAMAVLDVPELFQLAARVQFGTSSVLPRLAEVRFDALVLGFAVGISVLASVICSVGPALQTLLGDRLSLCTGPRTVNPATAHEKYAASGERTRHCAAGCRDDAAASAPVCWFRAF